MNGCYERILEGEKKERGVFTKIAALFLVICGICGSFLMTIYLVKAIYFCVKIQKSFNILVLFLSFSLILFFIVFYFGLKLYKRKKS